MGRDPDGLEKIKIQQEAVKRLEDVNKVASWKAMSLIHQKVSWAVNRFKIHQSLVKKKLEETYDKAKGPGKSQEMD